MKTEASDSDIPFEVTDCHSQPAVVPETPNLSW